MQKSLESILYAEDEPDIREIASMALESIGGFTLKVCNNGREAVEAAAECQPDLLLFDVMMPEMDGPMALAEIRKAPGMENIPIIFMTAKIQPQEVADYKGLGALDVIAKPFDPMVLAGRIQKIWSSCHGG